MLAFLFCKFVFYFVYSVLFFFVLFLPLYISLFPTFVQVYRPLAPGGNPIAVSHHIICRDYSAPWFKVKGSVRRSIRVGVNSYVALSSHIHILRPYFANKRHPNVALSGSFVIPPKMVHRPKYTCLVKTLF